MRGYFVPWWVVRDVIFGMVSSVKHRAGCVPFVSDDKRHIADNYVATNIRGHTRAQQFVFGTGKPGAVLIVNI